VLRVVEQVLPVAPSHRVALAGDAPVPAGALGVLGVELHRGRRHVLEQLTVLLDEIRELDVVPALDALADPLAVADDDVVGLAVGLELDVNCESERSKK
jgi:hypothetical protein